MNRECMDFVLRSYPRVSFDSYEGGRAHVKTHLLNNNAASANFVPLKNDSKTAKEGVSVSEERLQRLTMPLDIVILGVGEDGHTASLFPCSDELSEGMDLNTKSFLIATTPKTAPYERISLTAKTIIESRKVVLLLCGSSKLHTVEEAMNLSDPSKMPIYAFLKYGLDIFWST